MPKFVLNSKVKVGKQFEYSCAVQIYTRTHTHTHARIDLIIIRQFMALCLCLVFFFSSLDLHCTLSCNLLSVRWQDRYKYTTTMTKAATTTPITTAIVAMTSKRKRRRIREKRNLLVACYFTVYTNSRKKNHTDTCTHRDVFDLECSSTEECAISVAANIFSKFRFVLYEMRRK